MPIGWLSRPRSRPAPSKRDRPGLPDQALKASTVRTCALERAWGGLAVPLHRLFSRMFTTLAKALASPPPSVAPALVGRSPLLLRLREDLRRAGDHGCRAPVFVLGEAGSGKTAVAAALCERLEGGQSPAVLHGAHLSGRQLATVLRGAGERPTAVVLVEALDEAPPEVHLVLRKMISERERCPADEMVSPRLVMTLVGGAPRAIWNELWRRLSTEALLVPPLRDRPEDIPLLVEHFASLKAGSQAPPTVFAGSALRAMSDFSWPGNVRQLKAVVDWLASRHDVVGADDLPVGIRPRKERSRSQRRQPVVDELFRQMVVERLSFWQAVHALFMGRHITRADVRGVVRRGLDAAQGDDLILLRLFNIPVAQRGRFLRFLRAYECI